MSDATTFLREFLKHPSKVGAIAPSSPGLVARMIESVDWKTARNVVEFGPGTGVFTEAVLRHLHHDGRFFAIERSPEMARVARQRCPEATIVQASATDLHRLCDEHGIDHIDAVICGLPWASFPESLQREIIEPMTRRMKEGGTFATFAYWQGVALPAGIRFSKLLRQTFSRVERSPTVWRNLPPAFVYRCTK